MGSGARDVSVIIPYYNRELYIDEALQSVLAQTLQPLEIILVNDCSRESSRRFLDRYTGICRIIDLPVNAGLAASRNAGIDSARGQFIALLDDDDIWLPRKLEVQRKYLEEHPQCSGVHSAVWLMCPQQPDRLYQRFGFWWEPSIKPLTGPLTLAQALMNDSWVIPSTMMFRADVVQALGGFDPAFRQCEDRDFIIRFCAAGYQLEAIAEPLTRLRREGHSSLSRRHWRIFRTDLKMCWKHKELYVRAYGRRGLVWFVLDKLQEPTTGIPIVYDGVRKLLWFVQSKCLIKSSYMEPVGSWHRPMCSSPEQAEKPALLGGHRL